MSGISKEKRENLTPEERKKYMEEMKTALPEMKVMLEDLERSADVCAKQAVDPGSTYLSAHGSYTEEMFLPYVSTSPTAQYHLEMYRNYRYGCMKLYEFEKQAIETESDCDFLKEAFQAYAWAHMAETIMYQQFHPPPNTFRLLEEYLKRRPNDVFARYFRVAMIFHEPNPGVPKLEAFKRKIIEGEMLVESIRHLSSVKEERMVLISTYYLLGSMYKVTAQTERALDSFQKSLDLDPANIASIYGVAINLIDSSDFDGAIKLLHRYLDLAPRCDKKYPNALYQLGQCYILKYQNCQEALKYYKEGLKAEAERLPFIEKSHADIPAKSTLETLSKVWKMKKLNC